MRSTATLCHVTFSTVRETFGGTKLDPKWTVPTVIVIGQEPKGTRRRQELGKHWGEIGGNWGESWGKTKEAVT